MKFSDLPWLAYLAIQAVLRLIGLAALIVGIPYLILANTSSDFWAIVYFIIVIVFVIKFTIFRRKQ